MRPRINLYWVGTILVVGLTWLVGCQNTLPERNDSFEKPIPLPTASEILPYTQPYMLPSASPRAHPLPERSPRVIKEVPALDSSGITTLSPEEMATDTQWMKDMADITLDSIGQTFTYTLTSRFFVFLDDDKYPISQLKCEPEWVIGYISNGSIRGPDRYPIYYEATKIGKCTLRNGDFTANIVVAHQPTPVLPLHTPLPTYAPYP